MSRDQSPWKDQYRGWWSGMKEPDEINELACEHRPDESEKGNVKLSKAPLTGERRSRAFETMTIDRFGFCGEQNFH
jgi:hypothetical protein